MRVNINLFTLLAVFFLLADAAYVIWSLIDSNGTHVEWVGSVGIGLSAVLSFFLQFYLRLARKAQRGILPEDRLDATIDDGEAEQGHFSPWSWWPLVLTFGLALMFLGLAVGVWIAIVGAPIVLIGVVGWQFEYVRGNFAR
jgi:hypothetical protein